MACLPESKAVTISNPMIIGGLPRRSSKAVGGGISSTALVFTSDARGIFMGGSGGGFFLQASRRKRLAMLAMRAVSLETALRKLR